MNTIIFMNEHVFEEVHKIKKLGTILDNNLSWTVFKQTLFVTELLLNSLLEEKFQILQ